MALQTGSQPRRLMSGTSDDPLENEARHYATTVSETPGFSPPGESRSGSLLDPAMRFYFEPRLGHDFSRVRIHAGPDADGLARVMSANAFTVGEHVAFRRGQYSPALLGHELVHVAQQARAPSMAGVIQRDATDTAITAEYAEGLSDEDLLAQVAAVEQLLASQIESGDDYEVLTNNLLILREVLASRGFAGSSEEVAIAPTGEPAEPFRPPPPEAIPEGGEDVGLVGVVDRDREPQLRLRATPDTEADNVLASLPFNQHVEVIKRFPGEWLFVSTPGGGWGYAYAAHIRTDLPEPGARLHRVESGVPGTAIAIAERYYLEQADDWGQDLRFYVNVLAWANGVPVPDTTDGWREVHFEADRMIWIPSPEFARSLEGTVNSGSASYNLAESIGAAGFVERAGQLYEDIRTAVTLAWHQYLGAAILRHAGEALVDALISLAFALVMAIGVLAVFTAAGAAIGFLAGGAGAAPGAAAGFEIGMVALEWLGLAMLVYWIGEALLETGAAFTTFLGTVWGARGDRRVLDQAAQEFAEAIGILLGNVIEGVILVAASYGLSRAATMLESTRFGRSLGPTAMRAWLRERVRRARAGEASIPRPSQVLRYARGVEIVDSRGTSLGEFDGVDLGRGRFVESKSAGGLYEPNPASPQTEASWANRQIFRKTMTRIANMARATATRPTPRGSPSVPSLTDIQGIRAIHFVIDAGGPALRTAVNAELVNLRAANPGWTFTVEFGVSVYIPPAPNAVTGEERAEE